MKQEKIVLETERLLLRPWKKNKADAKALYSYAKDARVGPAAGWPVHKDPAESLQIIRDVLSTPDIYAVVLKAGQQIVGAAGLTYQSTGRKYLASDEAEIGYWIGVPHWGRGYAPEAVKALLRRAFLDLDMQAVWCGYYEGNEKSRRVQEKCGFSFHHTVPDTPCPLIGEVRNENFTRLTRDKWLELTGGT